MKITVSISEEDLIALLMDAYCENYTNKQTNRAKYLRNLLSNPCSETMEIVLPAQQPYTS